MLARDRAWLAALQSSLRGRVSHSRLMDARGWVAELERSYAAMIEMDAGV